MLTDVPENARKGNKAVSDGIQSAIEPEEIINISMIPSKSLLICRIVLIT